MRQWNWGFEIKDRNYKLFVADKFRPRIVQILRMYTDKIKKNRWKSVKSVQSVVYRLSCANPFIVPNLNNTK